jgi:hypothetical protein
MTIPNLHDRRALESIVAQMDTAAIDRALDEGGLSAFAREVAAEELARRVFGGEPHVGARFLPLSTWLADRAGVCLLVAWYVASLAGVLGMLR